MINKELNVRELKYDFLKNGIVTIKDWLEPEYANNLWNHLNDMPQDWWFVSSRPAVDGDMHVTRWIPENEKYIKDSDKVARESFNKGIFSYSFRRTNDDHVPECRCHECVFREDLLSDEVVGFLDYITSYKVTKINELFASWYTDGDFLGPHSDGPNGVLGFVYNLSSDWKPHYGGNLHFQNNEDESLIEKINVPKFNTLTMFDLSTSMGHMHFVSEVVKGVPSKRMAFAGWWGQNDENKNTINY
jgi:Rps23 Pro-64 3,4-dihydroxylase Tpa1-like proline 4-hydroxylase